MVHGLVAVPLPHVVHAQLFTRHSTSHPLAFRLIHTVADKSTPIAQRNRLHPSIALLPDIDTFRLAVSSLTHFKLRQEALFLTFYLRTLSSSDF